MKLSKKMQNVKVMENNERLFSCPICSSEMMLEDQVRFVCTNGHSFDLAKSGYVNLAPQAHTTKYDKTLFEARTAVMSSGFFEPIIHKLVEQVIQQIGHVDNPVILDAGCGEGTHLSMMHAQLPGEAVGIGIDLAKEGIVTASKMYPGFIWSVADLAAMPFRDEQIDVILNVLSPANFAEFSRLLKPGGAVVKVVPESGYLKELREVFYEGKPQKEESDPVGRFAEHFDSVQSERVTYTFELPEGLLSPLIHMTPLAWGAGVEKIEEALRMGIREITIDLRVIWGIRR